MKIIAAIRAFARTEITNAAEWGELIRKVLGNGGPREFLSMIEALQDDVSSFEAAAETAQDAHRAVVKEMAERELEIGGALAALARRIGMARPNMHGRHEEGAPSDAPAPDGRAVAHTPMEVIAATMDALDQRDELLKAARDARSVSTEKPPPVSTEKPPPKGAAAKAQQKKADADARREYGAKEQRATANTAVLVEGTGGEFLKGRDAVVELAKRAPMWASTPMILRRDFENEHAKGTSYFNGYIWTTRDRAQVYTDLADAIEYALDLMCANLVHDDGGWSLDKGIRIVHVGGQHDVPDVGYAKKIENVSDAPSNPVLAAADAFNAEQLGELPEDMKQSTTNAPPTTHVDERRTRRRDREKGRVERAESLQCPKCNALPGSHCTGTVTDSEGASKQVDRAPHPERFERAFPPRARAADEVKP